MDQAKTVDDFKIDRSQLLKPGMIPKQPLEEFHMDEESVLKTCSPGTWSNVDGTSFNVRLGPNYKTNGTKAPSKCSVYDIFAFDVYSTEEKKINNISRFYDMPIRDPIAEDYDIPPVLLINILIPDYAPPLWGAGPHDGRGYSMVFFGELTESSRQVLRSGNLSPALKLFQSFVRGGRDGKHGDCLKCIARVINTAEAMKSYGRITGLLISKYNGTPFLARDSPSFIYAPGKYFEIDLDAHLFGLMAKRGLYSMKDYIEEVIFDFGFLVEGRTNEENPEQILAAIRVSKAGKAKAQKFPFEGNL